MPLHKMLLVTFTRVATSELRDRIRTRLVETERGLTRSLTGADAGDDEVIALLATGSEADVRRRRDHLRAAVADFDAATIATTHSFCHDMLAELGTVGDLERGTRFIENPEGLISDVVDDLYVRAFKLGRDAAFGRGEAGKIAGVAIGNPRVPIQPDDAPKDSVPGMRRGLALAARQEFGERRRRAALMTYDDQLTRLRDVLFGPNGPAAAERLRQRFSVVLVDEFQDTDPVQWEILDQGFARGGTTLVLIADPKQAIYAFRGADVYAYLAAQKSADTLHTLEVNWRSDQGLIDAYDRLFADARLGHAGIVYRQVKAPPAHQTPRLTGQPVSEPLRVRLVRRDEGTVSCGKQGFINKPSALEHVAADLADDVVRLLSSGAKLESRSPDGVVLKDDVVRPGHFAVLVHKNKEAELIQGALHDVGVPAVINGSGSVFETDAGRDWLRLLEALERPASSSRARAVALSVFIGWDAAAVAGADEGEREALHQRLHFWARVLRSRGVAALLDTITISEGLAARVLATPDGERYLTDLRHVSELLHRAAVSERLGTSGLAAWLRHRVVSPDEDEAIEERARRLETDDEAVQVITIHRSKGLEFPIVYCPFVWDPSWIWPGEPVVFHDGEADDQRTIDVALEGARFKGHRDQYVIEQRGEDLRLAYVALTRAMHQAVIWWVPAFQSHDSPLARLVFCKEEDGNVPANGTVKPTDEAAWARFQELAAEAPGCISVERSSVQGLPVAWGGEARPVEDLDVAEFDRQLDRRWRRTSYSDITAGAHDAWVTSEPEEQVEIDEPDAPTPTPEPSVEAIPAELQRPSGWAALEGGVDFGTVVHRALEATDFAAPDLEAELGAAVEEALAWRPSLVEDPSGLVSALTEAIDTPLGPLIGDLRLRDFGRGDRLDELEFEMPLVGGDDPSGRLTLEAIARVLRDQLPEEDPMRAYASRLEEPLLRSTVRGYLTGSIDLVLRLGGDGPSAPRFAVVDYKTNWLGALDDELTLWHYRPSALRAEMLRAHYGLQALLYAAALHRYLRWRVPGYDVERQFAGVFYLFLRGMAGAHTPSVDGGRCGVFAWKPPGEMVEALSRVLDEGALG
jgi:exodeoxyribonuclease V beta subunit